MDNPKLYKGMDGIPFRGPQVPQLKSDDPIQPVLVQDARVKVLDLSDPESLKEYERIWFEIGRGRYRFSAEERQFLPELKNWRILLRYSELYLEMPQD